MRKVKTVTSEQRSTLEILRIHFGEKGYYISPVAGEFRRHKLDFIAYQKDMTNYFLVVRPTPHGWVSITSFVKPVMHRDARQYLKKKYPARVWWSKKQLALPSGIGGWKKYFPAKILEELTQLAA